MSPRCRNCSPVPPELRAAAGLLERRWTMATIYACSSGAAHGCALVRCASVASAGDGGVVIASV